MNSKLTKASLPWYRHPWPWILMSGPFVVVVAGVITLYLAVVSDDGLVDDDYKPTSEPLKSGSLLPYSLVAVATSTEAAFGAMAKLATGAVVDRLSA